MRHLCPFNDEVYAAGLPHIGRPETHATGRFSLLRRPISGTPFFDGMGPWPYLWIDDRADVDALYEDFRHLVTVTVVTQPGYVPNTRGNDAVLLKEHFVYDPGLPPSTMSKRTRSRLRRCEQIGTFDLVTDIRARMEMAEIYEGLKIRRALTGRLADFPLRHFETIAALESSVFFRVTNSTGVGAMACGVVFGDLLQILHTAISEEGLRWNASYLLMHGLQSFSKDRGVRLLTGGMPAGGSDGLRIFKERWANCLEPVYMLRIVNDPHEYAALCARRSIEGSFFPAYRAAA